MTRLGFDVPFFLAICHCRCSLSFSPCIIILFPDSSSHAGYIYGLTPQASKLGRRLESLPKAFRTSREETFFEPIEKCPGD